MIENMLKKIDLFSTLNEEELNDIAKITTIKKLQKDNILFYEGEDADSFYLLLEGQLKLYKTGFKSQEVVLHYFTRPTMVAEMATLENIKFPATSIATIDETIIAIINKEKFLQKIKSDSKFSFHLVRSLTKKIKNLEVAINRNLIFDATTKVCSLVKENPNIFKTQKNIQIANLLNMAPETLSRTLAKLKKLQILDKDHNLIDSQKLEMFLEF